MRRRRSDDVLRAGWSPARRVSVLPGVSHPRGSLSLQQISNRLSLPGELSEGGWRPPGAIHPRNKIERPRFFARNGTAISGLHHCAKADILPFPCKLALPDELIPPKTCVPRGRPWSRLSAVPASLISTGINPRPILPPMSQINILPRPGRFHLLLALTLAAFFGPRVRRIHRHGYHARGSGPVQRPEPRQAPARH